MLVSALVRQVHAAGGFAAIIRHGDDQAGAILIDCVDRGRHLVTLERATDIDGRQVWRAVAQSRDADPSELEQAIAKRVRFDPDIWVVELDIADAERFAAEIIALS